MGKLMNIQIMTFHRLTSHHVFIEPASAVKGISFVFRINYLTNKKMGATVSRTDFEWSYTQEPHATRRKEMLSKSTNNVLSLRSFQIGKKNSAESRE